MAGNRKLLLAVLSLAMGTALAFSSGGLTDTFVNLALALNGVFAAGNGAEHFARRAKP